MKRDNKFLRAFGTGLVLALTGVLLLAGCGDKDEPSGPSVDVPALSDLPGFTMADGTAIAAADIVASAAEADTIIDREVLNNSETTVFAIFSILVQGFLGAAEYDLDYTGGSDSADFTDTTSDNAVTYKVKATGHVEGSDSGNESSWSWSGKGNVKVEWTDDYFAGSPQVLKGSVVSVAVETSESGNEDSFSRSEQGAIAYGLTVQIGGKWFRVIVDETYSFSYNSRTAVLTVSVSGTAKFYGSGETALKVVTIGKTNYDKFV